MHPDYQCDHCGTHKRIVGVRYCCQECADYDLCETCFQHALEFHPHHRYLAYDPPQYDVFGMLKEGEGRPVEAKEKGSQEGEGSVSSEVNQSSSQPGQSTTQPDQPSAQPSSQQSNQPAQPNQPSTQSSTQSSTQPSRTEPNETEAWTVVGDKRRRHHSQSVSSGLDDASKRLNARTKPPKQPSEKAAKTGKMTYKQAIQKSLPKQTNKEPLPIVSTGTNTNTNTKAKDEPSKENPPAETAEAPLELSIDKLFPPSFSIDYTLPFHNEPKYDLGYYDYPPEDGYGMPYREEWWPKTHYGQWREREMGLERNSYLQDPGLTPFIDYGTLPTYSSEELQVEEKRESDV